MHPICLSLLCAVLLGTASGIVYDNVVFAAAALNDVGDSMGVASITGPGVGPANSVVFLTLDHRTGIWYPGVRTGDVIDERTVAVGDLNDAINLIQWNHTGGSDWSRQGINDSRECATKLKFDDGSHGVFVIEPPVLGDFNADGEIDLTDYDELHSYFTGPGAEALPQECVPFDVDWDGDVDLMDFGYFQILFGG